jgi:hypothetical protein
VTESSPLQFSGIFGCVLVDVSLFFLFEDAQKCDQRQMQTLHKKQRQSLEFNWQSVSALIDDADDLICELHNKTCITTRQVDTIQKLPPSLRIKKLLETLSRKSMAVIDDFVGCRPDTVRLHILSLLENTSGNFKYR